MSGTITATMARWAAGVRYEDLSEDAVYQAKRFLLDSLGCALGGYGQPDVKIFLAVLGETAGQGPGTVIGSGSMDSGPDGLAQVQGWQLGPTPGPNTLEADVPGLSTIILFDATAIP